MKKLLRKTIKKLPRGLKNVGKKFGGEKVLDKIYNKNEIELYFQEGWADLFSKNVAVVEEYWNKYRFLKQIKKMCGIENGTKVLDVGCGISTVLHLLPEGNLFGVDPLADDYKKLYKYPSSMSIVKADGENIPYNKNFFDVVISSNALDHTSDYKQVVKEIKRVLRPNSFFALTLEYFNPDSDTTDRGSAHPHDFSRQQIIDIFEDDFDIIFQKDTPFIGLKKYVEGNRRHEQNELVIIGRLKQWH